MASQGREGYGVSEQRIDCEFKVVLIGDFEVGKCQILSRCERKESETGTAVTVKYETHTLHIEKKSVKAHIWCIIRQARNNVDSNADYKDADGVILVYDITNRKSFDCMTLCLKKLHRHAKKRQTIFLIGNKSDSENDREVLRKEAREFAKKNDLIFWEISALEGTNFDNALKDLLTKLVNINDNNSTNTINNTHTNTITNTHTNTIGNITYTIGNKNTFNNNHNLHLGSNLNLGSNWNLGDVHGDLNILSCFPSSTATPQIHNCFRTQLKFASPQDVTAYMEYLYRNDMDMQGGASALWASLNMPTSSPPSTSQSEGTHYGSGDIRNTLLRYQLEVAIEEHDHARRIANLSANMLNEVVAHVVGDNEVDEQMRQSTSK